MTSRTTLYIFKYFIILLCFISIVSPVLAQSSNSKSDAVQMKTYNYADTLQLDLYSIPSNDMVLKPTVVLMHGGGFTAGQRNGGDEKGLSTYLATKGFNVASINYRLSRKGIGFLERGNLLAAIAQLL